MFQRIVTVVSACLMVACSSGSGSGGVGTVSTNSTTPDDLVLASPLEVAVDTSLGAKATGDAAGNDFAAKREALQALIAGTGDCSFTLDFPDVSSAQCYGPSIDYEGHPDGVDGPNGPNSDGPQLPSGDVGIWSEVEDGTACAAAQANTLINDVAAQVDNAISFFGAVACAQKKAEDASGSVFGLPTAGSVVDLTAVLDTYLEVEGLTYSSATIDRAADDTDDGFPIYTTLVSIELTDGAESQTGTWRLVHIPTDDDNDTYRGQLSASLTGDTERGGNCQRLGVTDGVVDGTSITYEKTSATSLVYEMNHAQFCGSETSVLQNGDLRTVPASAGDTEGWANNWNYGLFNLNPETVTGTIAYAWQAGVDDARSRVLNIVTTSDDAETGAASGRAYYGFGPRADGETAGTISGFICNWAGPGNLDKDTAEADLVQYQSIARASTGAVFTADESQITYAPTNSCDAAAEDGFTYASEHATESVSFDNDRGDDTDAVTNDLLDLEDVNFTAPTAPTEV